MKNEPIKIIGLALFFLVMGVILGYNMKSYEVSQYPVYIHDTEMKIENERH